MDCAYIAMYRRGFLNRKKWKFNKIYVYKYLHLNQLKNNEGIFGPRREYLFQND